MNELPTAPNDGGVATKDAKAAFDGQTLLSRNWAFISADVQSRLDEVTILLAGVGLASRIATLALQTGFRRFILADGDNVELSNLNRQAFTLRQVGQNKAEATAACLRAIRPDVIIDTIPAFLDTESLNAPLAKADFVINSIDFNNPALFALNRLAREQGKTVLMPLNLGWGGALVVFTPDAPTLESYLGLSEDAPAHADKIAGLMVQRTLSAARDGVPPYLASTLSDFLTDGQDWRNQPQLGTATALTAAMSVRAIVALVAGEPIRVAPAVNHVDLRIAQEPVASERAASTIRLRQQGERYPSLLEPIAGDGALFERTRPTGLRVRGLRHGDLSDEMRAAITAFRLDQYALHSLYQADLLADRASGDGDPSFNRLATDAIHVVAITGEGEMQSYACIEGPVAGSGEPTRKGIFARTPTIGDQSRLLFPTELELFGPKVFGSLPDVARLPMRAVRELTRITRNRVTPNPLAGLAVLEVVHALASLLMDSRLGVRLALGCASEDARRVIYAARIPTLFAPYMPYAQPQSVNGSAYWAEPGIAEGAFWPFLIAPDDLRAVSGPLQRLDQALNSSPETVRDAVERTLGLTPQPTPRAFARSVQAASTLWTSDPFFPVRRRVAH
jgi:hypothetical protein